MQLDQLGQLQKRRYADPGRGLLLQSGARLSVEHPARNRDVKPLARAHDQARLNTAPQRAHDLHFTTKERVMPVAHLRDTRMMGTVAIP